MGALSLSYSHTVGTPNNAESSTYEILNHDGCPNLYGIQLISSPKWLSGVHSRGQLVINVLLPAWRNITVPPSGGRIYCSLHLPTCKYQEQQWSMTKVCGEEGTALYMHCILTSKKIMTHTLTHFWCGRSRGGPVDEAEKVTLINTGVWFWNDTAW